MSEKYIGATGVAPPISQDLPESSQEHIRNLLSSKGLKVNHRVLTPGLNRAFRQYLASEALARESSPSARDANLATADKAVRQCRRALAALDGNSLQLLRDTGRGDRIFPLLQSLAELEKNLQRAMSLGKSFPPVSGRVEEPYRVEFAAEVDHVLHNAVAGSAKPMTEALLAEILGALLRALSKRPAESPRALAKAVFGGRIRVEAPDGVVTYRQRS